MPLGYGQAVRCSLNGQAMLAYEPDLRFLCRNRTSSARERLRLPGWFKGGDYMPPVAAALPMAAKTFTTGLAPAGNAPLLSPAATSAPRESVSRDFQVAMLPYKSRSLATPEGEILATLYFELLVRVKAERQVKFPLRGKGGALAPKGVHFHRAKPGCTVFLPPKVAYILIAAKGGATTTR